VFRHSKSPKKVKSKPLHARKKAAPKITPTPIDLQMKFSTGVLLLN
jgi:hypothetical protein